MTCAILLTGLLTLEARGESLLIAVASNFAVTAQEIAALFATESGHDVRISTASTGKLYLQIRQGAPFDVLLAADSERPQRLESAGLGVRGSRFSYAVGRLVLWSRDPELLGADCRQQLGVPGSARLAIANPDTAPYGAAARQALVHLDLWDRMRPRLVIGENIAQALQFAVSGNARFGLVALSQIRSQRLPEASCLWQVPADLHEPIVQQAILLARATNNEAANEFLHFLRGPASRKIIARQGYRLPGHTP